MRPVRNLPERPGWGVVYLSERERRVPATVHIGNCPLAGKNTDPLSTEEARRILTEGRSPPATSTGPTASSASSSSD
ncbi:DUF6233 domain-containing protein [Streptomyces sp. NPDC020472]|uniref:DUF6233 domain-containing protein n=1 Tax=Streptomyces sp. NPDC020472 TaxID=3365075 RepID=UPI0037B3353F